MQQTLYNVCEVETQLLFFSLCLSLSSNACNRSATRWPIGSHATVSQTHQQLSPNVWVTPSEGFHLQDPSHTLAYSIRTWQFQKLHAPINSQSLICHLFSLTARWHPHWWLSWTQQAPLSLILLLRTHSNEVQKHTPQPHLQTLLYNNYATSTKNSDPRHQAMASSERGIRQHCWCH